MHFCLPHDNATALNWQFYQHHRVRVDKKGGKTTGKTCQHTSRINSRQQLTKGWEGGNILLHCPARKENWLSSPSMKLTSCLIPRFPIQCERTSFPASFASSAGRKNICIWFHESWICLIFSLIHWNTFWYFPSSLCFRQKKLCNTGFVQVMENLESCGIYEFNFRPGKSWNFSEGGAKSWKSNMLSKNKNSKRWQI